MTALAVSTVLLAAGTWAAIRWAEAGERVEHDIAAFVLTVPIEGDE